MICKLKCFLRVSYRCRSGRKMVQNRRRCTQKRKMFLGFRRIALLYVSQGLNDKLTGKMLNIKHFQTLFLVGNNQNQSHGIEIISSPLHCTTFQLLFSKRNLHLAANYLEIWIFEVRRLNFICCKIIPLTG